MVWCNRQMVCWGMLACIIKDFGFFGLPSEAGLPLESFSGFHI